MLDDVVYNTLDVTPAELSEFQEKFFLIMNVAVGGNWPGSPDASTVFPQTMYVDYVRVFQ
jgi:beta-glucanase (GH16 family)